MRRLTPCQRDYEETGRDWTEVPSTSGEARQMTALCRTSCPMLEDCYRLALDQDGFQHGVWGGLVWRNGKPVDPHHDALVRRSVHEGVAWDGSKRGAEGVGMWKAFGVKRVAAGPQGRRTVHLGYFHHEEDAAAAYAEWVSAGRPVGDERRTA